MIKKKLDKVMALMLSGTLALSLAACGSQPAETTESTETTSTTESVAGTQEASADPPVLFESAYGSKAEALQAGLDLNVAIAEEGMILLKNEADALPLAKESKVTLLGYAAIAPNAGASKNGGDASAGSAIAQANVISGMEDAGLQLNHTVLNLYTQWSAEEVEGAVVEEGKEAPKKTSDVLVAEDFAEASQTEEWKASLEEYSDAAFVVISGGTGEGRVHSLQLDAVQYDLIDYATENFDKVIVLVNSCTPIEIAEIQRNEAIDAVLNIGEPGDNGFEALGRVITGEVNPSGKTVDTWAVDFTENPSYTIFNTTVSATAQGVDGNGTETGYTQYSVNGELVNTWSVGYEEGIYVGYRYYETRSFEENKTGAEDAWWNENVNYPFGYGLSYTDFTWEVAPATAADSTITKADTLTFDVTVTNTGDIAGKEVVQLYYTAPYGTEETGNETVIEKSYVVLGDYAKTQVLEPGASETLQVSIDVSDMASYDEVTDRTYVLDAGTYNVKIAGNAHYGMGVNDVDFNYTVADKELCNEAVTGAEVTNALDDVTGGFASEGYTALSRSDFEGTMPDGFEAVKEISEEEYATWNYDNDAFNAYYDATEIGTPVYETDAANRTSEQYATVLSDLIGAEADDSRYQELVEQLTLEEMVNLVNVGGFNSIGIPYIGKPYSRDTDGPKGWTGNYTDTNDRFNYFSSEPMVAATFNDDLLFQLGEVIGEQGLWGNSTAENGIVYSYTGWYAPGMNIHRSPFDSRATEYYSEDPYLTGSLATNASKGASSKGCYITLKHFAFHNDGGGASTYRFGPISSGTGMDGLSVWMTEQTAREVYLKGYQQAVEEGNATFAMGSFTRIGKTWCSGSYGVINQITRGEWGFDGAVVTDIVLYNACNAYQLIKAGANMMLDARVYGLEGGIYLDAEEILAMEETDKNITIHCLQEASKQILYMVANSNAMQLPKGTRILYTDTVEVDGEDVTITLTDAKVGEAYTSEEALNTAILNTYYPYAAITYTVEGLPEGMSFDAATGLLSGTPSKAGNYTVKLTAEATGYEPASIELPLVVAE